MERRVGLFVLLESLTEMIQQFRKMKESRKNADVSQRGFLKLTNGVLIKRNYQYSYYQI